MLLEVLTALDSSYANLAGLTTQDNHGLPAFLARRPGTLTSLRR